MKNYNEMAKSALNRIKEHEVAETKRKKMLVRTLTLAISFCLVAVIGFGVWQSGIFDKNFNIDEDATSIGVEDYSDDANKGNTNVNSNKAETAGGDDGVNESKGENQNETTNIIADKIGWIVYNGTTYEQVSNDNIYEEIAKLQTDKYLGNAKDFEGFYKNDDDVDGKVYTVKGYSNILLIHLDNGGEVLLKPVEK